MKPVIKNLQTKLARIEKKHKASCLKWAKESDNKYGMRDRYLKRASRALADVLPLRYLKRRNVFVNYKESCAFDPVSGEGHSYRWYALTRVIKGRLVLNTFSYSNQTAKHVRKVESLLDLLGAKYLRVQAPRGLQNKDDAAAYGAELIGKATVKLKYARIKRKYSMTLAKANLATLSKIGIRVTKAQIKAAIETAEADRAGKLQRQRERVKFVQATESDKDKTGLHIIRPRMPSRWGRSDIESEAQAKGFRKVWVHIVQEAQTT